MLVVGVFFAQQVLQDLGRQPQALPSFPHFLQLEVYLAHVPNGDG